MSPRRESRRGGDTSTLTGRVRSRGHTVRPRAVIREWFATVRPCAVWRSKIVPIIIRELSRRQRLPRRTARRSAFIWTSSSKLAAWRVSRATRTARPVHRARSPRALRLRSQVTSCSSPDVLLTWCGVVWCAAGLWARRLGPRMDGTDGLQRALQKSQCASSTVRSP